MFSYRRYLWQRRKQMLAWTLRRRSVREGFILGNRVWQVVGLAVHGRRLLRKVMGSEPQLVASERLEPGQKLVLRAIDPRSERGG